MKILGYTPAICTKCGWQGIPLRDKDGKHKDTCAIMGCKGILQPRDLVAIDYKGKTA